MISAAFSVLGIPAATQKPSMGGPSRLISCHNGDWKGVAGEIGLDVFFDKLDTQLWFVHQLGFMTNTTDRKIKKESVVNHHIP